MKKIFFIFFALLSLTAAFSQSSIKYINNQNEIVLVPIVDGKITFYKTEIIKILPENLEMVQHIKFQMVHRINDYSFFKDLKNIVRLDFFTTSNNDYTFLQSVPTLESLWIEGDDLEKKKLDFTYNHNLRNLSLTNTNLRNFNNIIGLNNNIELILLWFNHIIDTPDIFTKDYPKATIIFIEKNIGIKINNQRIIYDSNNIPIEYFTFIP